MFQPTALTCLDSYKLDHRRQYPDGITKVYSNFTPRSVHHFVKEHNPSGVTKIVWVGLQEVLLQLNYLWDLTFFGVSFEYALEVNHYPEILAPFTGPGFDLKHLEDLHKLGYLPLEIKALQEGTEVPAGVPVFTIVNTHPDFGWLVGMLETYLSTELWKMSTSATTARLYRQVLEHWADFTGGNKDFILWQCHDFSVRGMSGIHDAARSGLGHLISFLGTDNIPAVLLARQSYLGHKTFVGGSVPATEHSVQCAGGKESEIETYRRLMKLYPTGIISIVSDTWDFWHVITDMAEELKPEILARQPNELGLAKVVFRPDSGDPVKIICGEEIDCSWNEGQDPTVVPTLENISYWAGTDMFRDAVIMGEDGDYRTSMTRTLRVKDSYYEAEIEVLWTEVDEDEYEREALGYNRVSCKQVSLSPAVKGAVECLWDIFGGTINEKGYKTLDQHVGLIYGDSITPRRARDILEKLARKGFASDNIVFGVGSYTYNYTTRDTLGFAMKSTCVAIDGEWVEIFKDPVTDSGTKKSAKGLLRVEYDPIRQDLVLHDQQTPEQERQGLLQTVYLDGNLTKLQSLEEIRNTLYPPTQAEAQAEAA